MLTFNMAVPEDKSITPNQTATPPSTVGGLWASMSWNYLTGALDKAVGGGRLWTHVRFLGMTIAAPPPPVDQYGYGNYEAVVTAPNAAMYVPAVLRTDDRNMQPGEHLDGMVSVMRMMRAAYARKVSPPGQSLIWQAPLRNIHRKWHERQAAVVHSIGLQGHAGWVDTFPVFGIAGHSTRAISWCNTTVQVEFLVEARCDVNPFGKSLENHYPPMYQPWPESGEETGTLNQGSEPGTSGLS